MTATTTSCVGFVYWWVNCTIGLQYVRAEKLMTAIQITAVKISAYPWCIYKQNLELKSAPIASTTGFGQQ